MRSDVSHTVFEINEVGKDGTPWGLSLYWVKFAKVFSVSDCHPARSINTQYVLVKLAYFDDSSRFFPFGWIWASLILEANVFADGKWGKASSMFVPFLSRAHMAVAEGVLTFA